MGSITHKQTMSEREAQLVTELTRVREKCTRVELENKLLREKVDKLCRHIFGKKSEQLDDKQMLLLLEGLKEAGEKQNGPAGTDAAKDAAGTKKKKKAPAKPRVPDNLPIIEQRIVPLEVQQNPQAFRCIGSEVSKQLDYEPAKFIQVLVIREKYVSIETPHLPPVIAPLPPKLKDGHTAGPGLLAAIITGKYCDHLPLYRLQNIYQSRHGVYLTRQTMSVWLDDTAEWLEIFYRRIKSDVFSGGYIQMDETPVKYLAPGNGKTKNGYLWGCNRPGGGVIFDWSEAGRNAERLDSIVPEEFKGKSQTDAYASYVAHARRNPERIEQIYCWAHVRREFLGPAQSGCRRSAIIIHLIRMLYAVEAKAREGKYTAIQREALRKSESAMILTRIFRLLEAWRKRGMQLPSSGLHKAMEYTLSRKAGLIAYLEDGEVEIDNNLIENALRPLALGRKNWMFFGSKEAGQKSAILFTIVENCRRNQVDPFTYLRDVFTNIGNITNQNAGDWTPAAWAQRNNGKSRTKKMQSAS